MKQNKASTLPISKLSTLFNQSSSINTKGLLNPASEGNHFNDVIVDHFSNYIITAPIPKNNAQYAIFAIFRHSISNLVLLKNSLQSEEPNVLILKWQLAVLFLIFVILQQTHMLPGQMDSLKYKIKTLEPI